MKHHIYAFVCIVLLTAFSGQKLALAAEDTPIDIKPDNDQLYLGGVEQNPKADLNEIAKKRFDRQVEEKRSEYLKNTPPVYDQSQPINLDDGFTKNRPYVIDASTDAPEVLIDDYSGTFYLKIVNLVPSLRHQYSFLISSQSVSIPPFERTGIPEAPQPKQDPEHESTEVDGEPNEYEIAKIISQLTYEYCDKFRAVRDSVYDSDTEIKVRDARGKFNQAIVTGDYAICPGYAAEIKNVEIATTQELIFSVKRNKEYQVSIERPSLTPKKMKVTGVNKQWLSHFGFTFVRNKSESFYSADSGEASDAGNPTYIIKEQNDVDDYLYSAAVLLTYPFSVAGDWKFGITTGLGANNESIFLYLGPSMIIHENFLITAGFVIQEFDVLNGTYDEGKNIGETPIDSDNLVQSTYKPSFGISLGYRFSD